MKSTINSGMIITGGVINATNLTSTFNYNNETNGEVNQEDDFMYDVGLSFAGEDRGYANLVKDLLNKSDLQIFYDYDQSSDLVGHDLFSYLSETYFKKCRFCIVLVSQYYMNKKWTSLELQSIRTRNYIQKDNSLIPIILDETQIEGITDTIAYLDARELSPRQIADCITKKIRSIK